MLAALALLALAAPAAGAALTSAKALTAAYDAILDAEFQRVPPLLVTVCGKGWDAPAAPLRPGAGGILPPPACHVMDVVSHWWQLQGDPLDRRADADFERRANGAIAAAEAWTAAEPATAEA